MPKAPNIDFAQAAGLAATLAIIIALWDTWAVYPLRLLVVFFHELSHGIAAVATGGTIIEIRMNAQEGGQCLTLGGLPFIIASAGYLGSLIWGGVILLIATRTKGSQVALELLGGLLLIVTLIWVRPLISFGVGFGLITGLALIAAANLMKSFLTELVLIVIGLTSVLYAVLDIKSDILDRPGVVSDAVLLAEITHVPAIVWGIVWMCISFALALRFTLIASRRDSSSDNSLSPPAS